MLKERYRTYSITATGSNAFCSGILSKDGIVIAYEHSERLDFLIQMLRQKADHLIHSK